MSERVAAGLCPEVYEYYGMQETGTLTISTPADRKEHPDSIGTALCFAAVRILRADGSRADPGEIGEIVGRSPATATACFDNPQKTADTFRDGWVRTGDLGAVNEEGFVFIKGRLKDMIITGVRNVHAAEVEEVLIGPTRASRLRRVRPPRRPLGRAGDRARRQGAPRPRHGDGGNP